MQKLTLLGLCAFILAGFAAPDVDRHFELSKSEPAADGTLQESPESIRLWFTQAPQAAGARIRLMAGDERIELGEAVQSEADETLLTASVPEPLALGTYTVHWRAMARDGHVVTGEFDFTLDADE